MNSIILKSLKGITAASIEKYLIFTGWERDKTFANPKLWMFYSKADPEFRLAIPGNENSKDYYYKLYEGETIPYNFVSSQYPVLFMQVIGDDNDFFLSEETCLPLAMKSLFLIAL